MKKSLLFLVVTWTLASFAEVPLTFTYQGKLTDDGGNPMSGDFTFKVQLQDPSGTCLLYEEQHSPVTLTSGGLFSLSIGSVPTSNKRGVSDPGLTMEKIFSNDDGLIRAVNTSTCPLGYTPGSQDKRKMRVSVTNLATGTVTVLSPLQEIGVSPYSLLANKANNSGKFAGKNPDEFLQVEGSSVTQNNVKSLTDKVNEILALVNGNVTPTASCVSGSFNRWNGSSWVCEAPPASGSGTVTSVTAASTSGNPISIGGTAATPTVDIAKATASTSGYLSATDWNTFNSKLSSINSSQVTTALGYTPIQSNAELSALSGVALNGILQRTGSGTYATLGTTSPITVSGGNIGINLGTGFVVNGSNQLVPDFGNSAGKIAQGDDSRIVNSVQTGDARLPSSTCSAGSFNRWNGSAWVCEADQLAGSGANNSIISNWPDVIVCNVTNPNLGVAVFMALLMPNQNGKYWYRLAANTANFDIYYNADGTFSSYANLTTTDCNASISTLQASGKTFNIAKGPAAQWLQNGSNAYYNAGNVGIGTSSPSAALDVNGNLAISGVNRIIAGDFSATTPNGRPRFMASAANSNTWVTASPSGTGWASGYVATNSSDADNAPYMSVGINATAAYLNSYALGTGTSLPFNLMVNNAVRFHVTTGGNVGVGTSNPGQKLQVGASGDGTVAIANAWNTFSDIRLKKDFEKIQNACHTVDQLNGYYYHWKDGEDDSRQIGVIAQEVEQVLPELVKTGSDGIKTVDYPKLTAVLIEANKEQSHKLRQMADTIEKLKVDNQALFERMERIEKALINSK